MKTATRILFLLFFVILSPLFVFILTLRFSNYSLPTIKSQLANNRIYTHIVDSVNQGIDSSLESGESDDLIATLGPILKKRELTPDYLQSKVETFVDDLDAWLKGKTEEPPVLSFQDLKLKVTNQNPDLLEQLREATREMSRQRSLESEQTGKSDIPELDLLQFIESDFTFPLGKALGWLKLLNIASTIMVTLVGIFMIIFLGVIILLSETIPAKINWVGISLLGSSIFNIVPFVGAYFGTKSLESSILQNIPDLPRFVFPLISMLLQPFLYQFVKISGGMITLFFIIAIICFVLGSIKKKELSKVTLEQKLQGKEHKGKSAKK